MAGIGNLTTNVNKLNKKSSGAGRQEKLYV